MGDDKTERACYVPESDEPPRLRMFEDEAMMPFKCDVWHLLRQFHVAMRRYVSDPEQRRAVWAHVVEADRFRYVISHFSDEDDLSALEGRSLHRSTSHPPEQPD